MHASGESSPRSPEARAEVAITELGNVNGEPQAAPPFRKRGIVLIQAKQMELQLCARTSALHKTENALNRNQSRIIALFFHYLSNIFITLRSYNGKFTTFVIAPPAPSGVLPKTADCEDFYLCLQPRYARRGFYRGATEGKRGGGCMMSS